MAKRTRWPAGFDHVAANVTVTEDPGPEPSPLLQPPGITTKAPSLRSIGAADGIAGIHVDDPLG
ncbi:hypothetical protein NKG94_00895 [Micromonospora sp. M12]